MNKSGDQGPDLCELRGDASDLILRQEQQPIAAEERTIKLIPYGSEEIRLAGESPLQLARGGLGRLRRWRPDIDEDELDSLGKSRLKCDLMLPPR